MEAQGFLLIGLVHLCPLAGFVLPWLLGKRARGWTPALSILLSLVAAGAAGRLWGLYHGQGLLFHPSFVWLDLAPLSLKLSVGFLLDGLNLSMITSVTVITACVQLFSAFYMSHDSDRSRFFSFLSLFAFTMTGLVLSDNLFQSFVFWESVGLSSYLLIGFWFEKPEASSAAKKAFVLNRLCDLGFILGILILILRFGRLDFVSLSADNLRQVLSPETAGIVALLLFIGVMGKSAQFPFHVWLPDAMEGPTPVSALIHSATMVAAGIFLMVRAFGLFSAVPSVLVFILIIGTVTAVLSSLVASVQRDIKRILAYSTLSQLGFMVMAVGAGAPYTAFWHLTVHAFFKSLLFLLAGSLIHLYHTQDIFELGKKGVKYSILIHVCLLAGLGSLVGLFPFPGFFSKEAILHELTLVHPLWAYVGFFLAFLTAYYSFRLYFVIVRSTPSNASEPHVSASEALCQNIPLAVLLILSIVAGIEHIPWVHNPVSEFIFSRRESQMHFDPFLFGGSLGAIGLAALLTVLVYRNPQTNLERMIRSNPVRILFINKFFIDSAYRWLNQHVFVAVARLCQTFDLKFINEFLVDGGSRNIGKSSGFLSKYLQSGLLQNYLSWVMLGVIVFMAVLVWKEVRL